MKLTTDEARALAFIAALLCLSAAVRIVGLPAPVSAPAEAGIDLAAHIEAVEAAVAEAEAVARPLEPGETIDPNTATSPELRRLPGIGPSLAARIVADREANGRFVTLAELGRVPGVGERTLERLAPHVALPAPRWSPGGSGSMGPAAAPRAPGAGAGVGTGAPPGAGGAIDINRAGVEELTRLPGIGPVLAERIVAYRDSVGRFREVSELTAVKGIGEATLARFVDRVTVR